MLYLLRGYQEDSEGDAEPGTLLDVRLPVWRIGECVLHAQRMARTLLEDDEGHVLMIAEWEGLRGRKLGYVSDKFTYPDPNKGPCRQERARGEADVPHGRIETNLPEIVTELTRPLYEAFDFYSPAASFVQRELARMRGR
jgi:hypothetical protein